MRNKVLVLIGILGLVLTTFWVSCKRYETYIDDKVLVPPLVMVHYNAKKGYRFSQAGYNFVFIAEPTPPLVGITYYKLKAYKKGKPVKDLKPLLYGTQIERKSKDYEMLAVLSPDPNFEGIYKEMLNIRLGGVYKFLLVIKDKQDKEIARRTFNVIVHNLPSEKAFKAYEQARIEKEKKEFERKKALEKKRLEAKAKRSKERYSPSAQRYEQTERYSVVERYGNDNKPKNNSSKTTSNHPSKTETAKKPNGK